MPQKLWNKYDWTFEAKGQKVQRWQKNSLIAKLGRQEWLNLAARIETHVNFQALV